MASSKSPIECPVCNGEGIVETVPAGAGHDDDLAEYEWCSACNGCGKVAEKEWPNDGDL